MEEGVDVEVHLADVAALRAHCCSSGDFEVNSNFQLLPRILETNKGWPKCQKFCAPIGVGYPNVYPENSSITWGNDELDEDCLGGGGGGGGG